MEDSKIHLSEEQKTLVERLGMTYERSGMTQVASRILGLLLVSEDPDLTFDQLQATLGVSKSAISNSLNFLINTNKIEEISRLGERKRYFRSKVLQWKEEIKKSSSQMTQFTDLLKTVLKQRPGNTLEFNQNLAELIDFMEFMREEMPMLFKKWESRKK
ncbi:MAG: MarR family transcriptional regulator [Bacteroidia bacterium]|nr:MarR family transcriptional regulator [Bacteroidia bacterium]